MHRLASITSTGLGAVLYTYDTYGKLIKISRGTTEYNLTYDTWNRPLETKVGTTALSTNAYDSYGRLSSVTYANGFTAQYTYDELDRVTEIHLNNTLTYAFIYNAEGNLYEQRNYRTHRATFFDYDHAGRCMASLEKSFTGSGSSISYGSIVSSYKYEYDVNNILTNVDTDYFYNGSVLIGMQRGTDKLLFSYDASGNVVSVDFNGTEYYYLRNAQGDIVKLIDNSGATVVEYTYDTWGKQLSCTGSLASTLGALNPFRYRGYVYDEETGFYYLQSRYYDPTTCRFISADVLLSTGQGVLGHNAYAYCLNNPVCFQDKSGKDSQLIIPVPEGGFSEENGDIWEALDLSISNAQCGEKIHKVAMIANLDYAMDFVMNEVSKKLDSEMGISLSETDSKRIRRQFKKGVSKYLSINHSKTYMRPFELWISMLLNQEQEEKKWIKEHFKKMYGTTKYEMKVKES